MATLATEYRRQRAKGWRAQTALQHAKTLLAFNALDGDTVRLRWIPDQECFDDSYIDTWTDQSEAQREQARKELWESIERDGVWGLVGEVRCKCCQSWEEVDSCWGFVGQDAGGYEFDIMAACLDKVITETAS